MYSDSFVTYVPVRTGVFFLFLSWRQDRALRLIAFGVFWFFITLSIESGIIPLYVIFEHRVYLPSAGAFWALSTLSFLILRRIENKKAVAAGTALLILLPIVLSIATYARNTVWKSEISLWEDVVRKSPGKIRGHNNLANAYESNGQLDKAIEHYLIALRLKPDPFSQMPDYYYGEIHYNLALAYMSKGLSDKVIEHYKIAIKLKPDNIDAYNNLGVAYFSKGLIDKAIEYYQMALRLKPDYANAYFNLGEAYFTKGLTDKSIKYYQIFLRYRPDYAEAHYNIGLAYKAKDLTDKAIEHYKNALRLKPAYKEVHEKLGIIYKEKGMNEIAKEHFRIVESLKKQKR